MVYSNTKLNLTYCYHHKYGSDSTYSQRHSRHWIKTKFKLLRPISNSNLGISYRVKSNCGMKGYNRTMMIELYTIKV